MECTRCLVSCERALIRFVENDGQVYVSGCDGRIGIAVQGRTGELPSTYQIEGRDDDCLGRTESEADAWSLPALRCRWAACAPSWRPR